jgi:hypothetical protein
MSFLNEIEMQFLSVIFFWTMCEAMREDPELRRKIQRSRALPHWMATQKFLRKYRDGYDVDRMTFELPQSEEEVEFSDDGSERDGWGDSDEWEEEDVGYHWPGDSDEGSAEGSAEGSDEGSAERECDAFRGLDYTGNSCYQDSVLLATFAVPNDVITDYILAKNVRDISDLRMRWTTCHENKEEDYQRRKALQNEIVRITNSMRKLDSSVRYCSALRRLIQRCPGTEQFHGSGMQDAGEFLSYLFNLFQVDVAKTSNTTYVTNDLGSDPQWKRIGVVEDRHASPVIAVSSFHIQSAEPKYINNFLVQTEDAVFTDDNLYRHEGQLYRRRRRVWRMVESPYMVFYIHRIQRAYRRAQTFYTPVIPVQRIGRLSLSAIVVHKSDHYTCYIKCRGIWFYYDDSPGTHRHTIVRIGTYDEMLQSRPSPVTNGTLYYYT